MQMSSGRSRRGWSFFLAVCGVFPVSLAAQSVPNTFAVQTPPAQSVLSEPPGLIYKEAMHPLEVVRASLGNWSASEIAALSVGMRKAREACGQTKPEFYAGDDLCDLARLCAMGQSWPGALDAARQCVERGPEARHSHAYATVAAAQVQMKNLREAQKTALEMLRVLPYDAEVASTLLNIKTVLEQDGNTGRTLELELAEQPAILAAIERHAVLTEAHGDALMSEAALYSSGMQLAFLQSYNFDKSSAEETVARLDKAIGGKLKAEDAATTERVRTAYKLLGAKLPKIKIRRALLSPSSKPQIDPNDGTATVLVLFPDWCASCREEMKTLTEFARLNAETPIRAYGLVFHDDFGVREEKPAEENWKDMEGTATLVVEAETARTFGATEYPLGVVVDHDGVVRFVGVLPDNAFSGDGYIERILIRMSTNLTAEKIMKSMKK